MAHTKTAKTTLAIAAALTAAALTPALAVAAESTGGAAGLARAATRAATGGQAATTASRGGGAPAATPSLGATTAPRAGEAQPAAPTGARRRVHENARAQRVSRKHGRHHHHHHPHHSRESPHLSDISYEGSSLATWFGPGLYGHHTACGQILTRQLAGVANRTLPCGTLVAVTYQGRTLTVPVVDRGPYGSIGASWDLTEKTAELLGITETVEIEAKIVGHAKNTPTLGLASGAGVPGQSPLEEEAAQQAGATGGAVAS